MTIEQPGIGGPAPLRPLVPHRGTTVLVLGILGLAFALCCPLVGIILAIIAWVLGNGDLNQMAQGIMDNQGQSNTNAGRICGMIGVGVSILNMIGGIFIYGSRFLQEFRP